MPEFELNILDWTVICLYFLLIIWRRFRYVKKHNSAEEYFLAGRKLTWPLIGLSLFASNMSSSSLVGLAGSGYATGISVFSYEWMAAIIVGTIMTLFFLFFNIMDIHYLYVAMILFIICNITIIIVSLLTSKPDKIQINKYCWSQNIYQKESNQLKNYPIYKNYRFQSFILILMVVIILIFYW